MHGDWRRPRDHVRACLGLGFSGSLPSAATPDPKNSTLGSYEFPHTSPEWGSEGGRVHGDWRRPRDHVRACLGLGFSGSLPSAATPDPRNSTLGGYEFSSCFPGA